MTAGESASASSPVTQAAVWVGRAVRSAVDVRNGAAARGTPPPRAMQENRTDAKPEDTLTAKCDGPKQQPRGAGGVSGSGGGGVSPRAADSGHVMHRWMRQRVLRGGDASGACGSHF